MMAAESMTGVEAIETGVTSLARLFFRAFQCIVEGSLDGWATLWVSAWEVARRKLNPEKV